MLRWAELHFVAELLYPHLRQCFLLWEEVLESGSHTAQRDHPHQVMWFQRADSNVFLLKFLLLTHQVALKIFSSFSVPGISPRDGLMMAFL